MQEPETRIASRIFRWAAIYGVIVLAPLLVLETRFGQDNPPPVTHAEFFYGFTALALVWQVVFFLIASDPARYRPIMIAAMLEKFSWGAICFTFVAMGRGVPPTTLTFASIDTMLGLAFAYAYFKSAQSGSSGRGPLIE